MADESYDVIIAGGGTAGLVLACRLSEDPGARVVVIEAGEDKATDPSVLTPAMWPMLQGTPMNWAYKTTPQAGIANTEPNIPQGRALGGSSAINSYLWTPNCRANFDAWAALGNEQWNWKNLDHATRKAFTRTKADGSIEGDGPLQLTDLDPESLWTKVWVQTLESLGFPACDPHSGNVSGALVHPSSIDPVKKQRSYAGNTYLEQAISRPNLTVVTGAAVTKILLDRTHPDSVTAKGVRYIQNGESKTVMAGKEVVVCAGAMGSPKLLELSGIGGQDLLRGLGIEVLVDNPYVGENLQDHPVSGFTFPARQEHETLDPLIRQDPEALAKATQEYAQGKGPMATGLQYASAQLPFPGIRTAEGKADLEALLRDLGDMKTANGAPETPAFAAAHEAYVRASLADPDGASVVCLTLPFFVPTLRSGMPQIQDTHHLTVGLLLSHPLSRGSVHITSASADTATGSSGLAIDPGYLSHPLDVEVLARHLLYLEKNIARAEPLASHLESWEDVLPDLGAAREHVKKTAAPGSHFTGGCSMMPREMGGVVDEKLRVYGCANLRVCDASIAPLCPRTNLQATVYGIAEMAAGIIKESL